MPILLRWFLRLWITNPIAVRLVQNGSRRNRHMLIRSAYLAALIVVLLWVILLSTSAGTITYQEFAKAGARSFEWIAYLQITLICILAPVFMGGAIAQEASPRNWEVLLTTPLTAGQIVLGNLFGRLFFVLALLFCSLPLFALTQYFGGVPGSAIFASYFVAAGAALLVGSIAIALSVSRLVGKRAFFVFYVAVVSYLAVTIAIDLALRQAAKGAGPMGQGVTMMTACNPFLALYALLNPTNYPRAAAGLHSGITAWFLESPVTTWCVGSTLLSMFFMVASVITVRAGGLQTLGAGEDGVPIMKRLFGRKIVGRVGGVDGDGESQAHRAPRGVWSNPIAWREAASRNSTPAKIAARIIFLLLGGGFGVLLIWLFHVGTFNGTQFQFAMTATLWGEVLVITLVAINTAATAISKEREEGTLDLLLTTPITASAYLSGKLRGLIMYLLPLLAVPLGTLLLAGLYILFDGFGREGGVLVKGAPAVLPEAGLIAPIVIVPFMAFCVMIGLHWSLKSRGTLSSTVGTVGIVGVVAGIIGLCGWSAMLRIPMLGPVLGSLSPASFLYACIYPVDALCATGTGGTSGLAGARVALAIGAFIAAAILGAVCYAVHSNMVRTFDMTVRKLAGNT